MRPVARPGLDLWFLLSHERTNNAQVHRSRSDFRRLQRMALRPTNRRIDVPLDGPVVARAFAEIDVELDALEVSVLRVLSAETNGREPGPEASIVQLEGSRLQQRISTLGVADAGR